MILFRKQKYLIKHLESFPYIETKLNSFLVQSGLSKLDPDGYCLYGSFLRSLWTKEITNNINIAFLNNVSFQKYQEIKLSRPLNTVSHIKVKDDSLSTVGEIIEEADFTICQLAYSNRRIYFSRWYFEHLAQKILLVNQVNRINPFITFLRTYKYIGRRYRLPMSEFDKILCKLKYNHLMIAQDDIQFHSDGHLLF